MARRLCSAMLFGTLAMLAADPALSASAGTDGATIAWSPEALVSAGLTVGDVQDALAHVEAVAGYSYGEMRFSFSQASSLVVERRDGAATRLGAGMARAVGGLTLSHGDVRIDLHGFGLRAAPEIPFDIEVVDSAGTAWLTADHPHYGFTGDGRFFMRHMNLRASEQLARFVGKPELAGYLLGTLDFEMPVDAGSAAVPAVAEACEAPWPEEGLRTDIELTNGSLSGFADSIYAPRCGLPPLPGGGACTATSTNGKLVLGPDASLRNAGQTAVPWHGHFSGDFAPYGTDQHPYLIWNLYRVDADGRIRQIAASGAKHAFYSINLNCGCAGGNVIWPGCEDVYSFASNDNGGGMQNLAPRSEIIPYTGQWARCGSVWDADCDGRMDPGSGAQDLYQYRMQVEESDILPPLSDGARYFFEYWYVVRDDVEIYNSMGHREIALRKSGANWLVDLVGVDGPQQDFFSGPVINRWIDPSAETAQAMNRELATPLGRVRVASKATPLDGGRWRYEYAVMNLDYAQAEVDPVHASEPDLKLLSNHGLARFGVPIAIGAMTATARFDDADADVGNDWVVGIVPGKLTWDAGSARNTLDWGTLYHFEFVSDVAPSPAVADIAGAKRADGSAPDYEVAVLAPSRDEGFRPQGHSRHATRR